jgi:hypothetical protein
VSEEELAMNKDEEVEFFLDECRARNKVHMKLKM